MNENYLFIKVKKITFHVDVNCKGYNKDNKFKKTMKSSSQLCTHMTRYKLMTMIVIQNESINHFHPFPIVMVMSLNGL